MDIRHRRLLQSIQDITVIVAARSVDAMFTAAALLQLTQSRPDIRIIYTGDLGTLPLKDWGEAQIALIGFGPDTPGVAQLLDEVRRPHAKAHIHSIVHYHTADAWAALLGPLYDKLMIRPSPSTNTSDSATCGDALLHGYDAGELLPNPDFLNFHPVQALLDQAVFAGQGRYSEMDPCCYFERQIGDDRESDRKRVYMTRYLTISRVADNFMHNWANPRVRVPRHVRFFMATYTIILNGPDTRPQTRYVIDERVTEASLNPTHTHWSNRPAPCVQSLGWLHDDGRLLPEPPPEVEP